MIQNLNEQKAKLKKKLNEEVEEYFSRLEASSSQEGFDIKVLEQLMLENQRRLKTAMNETNSDLASNVETSVKKNAQNAEND